MSAALIAAVAALVFGTSVVSGVFGMAGGLVLLGWLLALLPVATAIAVQGAIQTLANGSRAWFSRSFIDWRILGFICLGIAIAAAALLALAYRPELPVVCIVIGLTPILVWIPQRWLALDASRPGHAVLCGVMGGGLNLMAGVAGPSIDIFFIRTLMDRRRVIATKAAAQVVSHLGKVGFYGGLASAMAGADWVMVAIAAPFAILGTQAGYLILQRMSDQHFRRWTRLIVTMIGIFYLGRGLTLLLGA
ncbi:MAG: TSUP family transporter [Rhodobacterales bacterium]|nr:TSUP family transporter [Rhodobacterales bacterium]MDX5500312.1 TSUP family transporter [Rhodobacterales bacterium]